MKVKNRLGWLLGLALVVAIPQLALAQDLGGEDDLGEDPLAEPPPVDAGVAPEPEPSEPEPLQDAAPAEPEPVQAEAEAGASVDLSTGLNASASSDVSTPAATSATTGAASKPQAMAPSRIARPIYKVDGATIIDSPLRTDLQGKEYLQTRRQYDGIAVPDTTAALGHGAAGMSRFDLRLLPSLVLLNQRRLVSAPVIGANGTDFVDINQLPIQLMERVELTSGLAAGLWGAGAIGGVANFKTRRDIEGIDIELGGQATDKLDQGDLDVAVTLGTVGEGSGANLMLSYFNRQPLAASDRDWIGEREDRVESLIGSPANYQKLINGDYPLSDPYCNVAQESGYSNGYEVRLRGYGPTSNFPQLSQDVRDIMLAFANSKAVPGSPESLNMTVDPLETATYCAVDYTRHNDLILKDERLQSYGTFWHDLSKHTEVFGEAGFYRSENENRTAPSFPVTRLAINAARAETLTVPAQHADHPTSEFGYATAEVMTGRTPGQLFYIGRTQGNWNGDGINDRRVDVMRGVLGLRGDFAGLVTEGPLQTWNWELSGMFSRSDQVSRVNDTLMSALGEALAACNKTRLNPSNNMQEPTTIKFRQEAGCFSPFYSAVTNNAAVDPLNVSAATAANAKGFITTDSDAPNTAGSGTQDGGYICDPAVDPSACPASFDRDGDGVFELAGTPNTKQVIDRITGEHFEVQQRTLGVVGASLGGDIATFGTSSLAFGLGAELRTESLFIDYDQAYNERDYGFLFGGDDVDPVSRNVIGANLELRLRIANGVLELQPAVKAEIYEEVGTGLNAQVGLFARPFANSGSEALEWLGLRAHAGIAAQPPSLIHLYGAQNEFVQVDYKQNTQFIAHQVSGNPDLDFERYTTLSLGPQWDFAGLHVGADAWMTFIDDMIGSDNSRTLTSDCEDQFDHASQRCGEMSRVGVFELLDHLESRFDNLAEVDTNGVDGVLSYTLDTERRKLGGFGTFLLAVQATYINSYLIKSPRALPSYYRDNAPAVRTMGEYPRPVYNADTTRDYSNLTAEYEAAGYRNFENFAPPIPKLRFSVPLRWMYEGHTLGATLRFIDGYNDDSEYTIERQSLPGIDSIQFAEGESIPSWMALDALYGFAFDADGWKGAFTVGVLNIADTPPPAVESPLGYEIGVHDPRGRTLHARVSGDF